MTTENNKKQGMIYLLKSNETDKVYVGSTFKQYLSSRLAAHKYEFRNSVERNHPYSSFELVKYADVWIELYEVLNCENVYELRKRENEVMKMFPTCVNIKSSNGRDPRKKKATNHRKYERDKEVLKEKCACPQCGKLLAKYSLQRHQKSYCKI